MYRRNTHPKDTFSEKETEILADILEYESKIKILEESLEARLERFEKYFDVKPSSDNHARTLDDRLGVVEDCAMKKLSEEELREKQLREKQLREKELSEEELSEEERRKLDIKIRDNEKEISKEEKATGT